MKKPVVKEILEWGYCFIIAFIVAILVKYFVGAPTVVKQQSMNTTLLEGQRLWLNRIPRTFNQEYKRGDIITFEAPSTPIPSLEQINYEYPVAIYDYKIDNIFEKFCYYVLETGKKSYIKRIIGIAGDHVRIEAGKVYLNEKLLEEPYLDEGVTTINAGQYIDVIVPENCVFVMGDNREHSTDSRSFGCIPIEKIESRVGIRFWPFSKFGKVE